MSAHSNIPKTCADSGNGALRLFAKLENPVHNGDRIEIYQRITRELDDDDEEDD